jgi:hypothetical protein
VEELGHFVAHRERDKGVLLRFLKTVQASLLPGAHPPAHFDAPVSIPVLHSELNRLLALHRFPSLTLAHIECVVVVLAALLHDVRFTVPGGLPWHSWRLEFGFNAQFVGLFGVVPIAAAIVNFPVMAVQNRFFSSPFDASDTCWFPDRGFVVSASCHAGNVGFSLERSG